MTNQTKPEERKTVVGNGVKSEPEANKKPTVTTEETQPDQGVRDAAANPIDKDGNKIQTTEQQHIANAEPGKK